MAKRREAVTVTVTNDGANTTDPKELARQKNADVLLQRARRDFRTVASAESKLRESQFDDKKFRASYQWDDLSMSDRQADRRPYLTINRLGQFIRQVTNSQRQANLSIKVNPVDDASDIKTAEVFQGIIRHIEEESDASVAYSTAGEDQATIGRGWWRVRAEYTDERSFTQDLRIKRIRNAFSVYMDPASQELDGSDARYVLVVHDIPKDAYIERFGEASFASLTQFSTAGNEQMSDWMPEGAVRVAEYWYVDIVKNIIVLVQFPDGSQEVITQDDLVALQDIPEEIRPIWTEIARREVEERHVKMALINANEILEGNEAKTEGRRWPGKWIPIVPAIGEEIDINGEVDLRGMVRDAKDPQRLYNFQNTALAEVLAQAPMTQWIGYAGSFEGHESKWNQINRRRFPYVEVNAVTLDGKPAPLPQRITAEPPIRAIVEAIHQADNDLKATMGLYDPSLGQRGAQQSGKAITALQQQGELANSNFMDNLSRSIRFTGRILVDLIPHYYDAPRVVRILGPDEEMRAVMVHSNASASALPKDGKPPDGVQGIYNLGAGRYDVVVTVGPSMPTRRAEAVNALNTFINAYPDAFPAIGDLLVKNMDWPGSQVAAARLKKLVPPHLRDDGDQPQLPPEAQAQMAQLQQQLQAAMQELTMLQQEVKAKRYQADVKAHTDQQGMASDERIAQMETQAKFLETQMKIQGDIVVAKIKAGLDQMSQMMDQVHQERQTMREHAARHAEKAFDAASARQTGAVDMAHERATDAVGRAHEAETGAAARDDAEATAEAERAHRVEMQEALHAHELVKQKADAKARLAQAKAKPKPKVKTPVAD